jgi:hypothetical protein
MHAAMQEETTIKFNVARWDDQLWIIGGPKAAKFVMSALPLKAHVGRRSSHVLPLMASANK